jgi:hypothetical protein
MSYNPEHKKQVLAYQRDTFFNVREVKIPEISFAIPAAVRGIRGKYTGLEPGFL